MKNLLLILSVILFFSCTNSGKENQESVTMPPWPGGKVSFISGQGNRSEGIIVAYTEHADSLWLDKEWVKAIKSEMKKLSSTYSTVLLFSGEKNMPNVAVKGMNYSSDYDKYMVCGYWIYPNGNKKFCYGGVKSDGNFKKCE